MAFEILEQGMIARQPSSGPDAVAACSRCVVTGDGSLVCSFAVQEALGQNDFKQVIVHSNDGGRARGRNRPICGPICTMNSPT